MSDFESDYSLDSSDGDLKGFSIDLSLEEENDDKKKKGKAKKTETPKKKETKATTKSTTKAAPKTATKAAAPKATKSKAKAKVVDDDDDDDDKPTAPAKRSRAKSAAASDAPKSKKDKKEEPTIPDSEAPQFIINYLNDQNRPFNAINLFENLHRRVKKTFLTNLLDDLASKNLIKEKAFGKFKFYFANQDQYGEIADSELDRLDGEIEQLKDQEYDLKATVSKLDSEVKQLESSMTTDQLEKEVAELTKKVNDKQSRVDHLRGSLEEVPPDVYKNLMSELKKCVTLWTQRKSTVNDFISTMAEGMEKSPAELIEMFGIETDEEVGVNLKEIKSKLENAT